MSRRRPARRNDRGALHTAVPPALALVVSSPAIVSGLSGTADPIQVLTVVAVSLSVIWVLFAVMAHLGSRPQRVPVRVERPTTHAADAGSTALGRIEPVRVPASEAIPGDPPPTSPTEGPLA